MMKHITIKIAILMIVALGMVACSSDGADRKAAVEGEGYTQGAGETSSSGGTGGEATPAPTTGSSTDSSLKTEDDG